MKSRLLGALCLCVGFLPFSGSAATFAIDSMTITDGRFERDIGSGIFQGFAFDAIGPNTDLVSGYIGNSGSGVVSIAFGPSPINAYTAAANLGDVNTPAGTLPGGPVPTGILDNSVGTITMDLSSWFANFDGTDFHAGTGKNDGSTSASANGTWDPLTGSYSLSWTSVTAVFGTTVWTLEGVAAPVPIPPALYLFGTGLLGLVGMARRKEA
jgi:hypothetical protein